MESLCKFCVFIVLPMITTATIQRANFASPSYMAAVAEYSPVREAIYGKSVADINADNYLKFIDKAADYAIDIIVFPESSLSIASCDNGGQCKAASYVPDPTDNVVPCNDDSGRYANSLKRVSCAAKDHSMYVVVNHQEKVDCLGDDCSNEGYLIYNTNVAFDRNGQVVARYRKYNLYGEAGVNKTNVPIPSMFTTDFGVTFGQFICFDILFETPALNLTRDHGITDVIFSSHWFSELPYLYSVEAQAGWAYANDVNLLSSGYNYPKTASGGSGIFLGKQGYVKVVLEDKRTNMLIMSEVPKVINGKRRLPINEDKMHVYKFTKSEISTTQDIGSGIHPHIVDDLSVYTTELLNLTTNKYNNVLCDRGFCCEFSLKMEFDDVAVKHDSHYYRYRLAIFNGTRTFTGRATGGVKTCGIIACTNATLQSCGRLIDSIDPKFISPTTFHSIDIKVKSESDRDVFFMPITFTADMMPLNTTKFFYESVNMRESSVQYMQLKESTNNLLTFSIYGRNFVLDGSEVTTSAAARASYVFTLLSLIAAFSVFSMLK